MTNVPDDLIGALRAAHRVMVFTGAGVSAESGLPTFRDKLTGLWERFAAEDLATPEAYRRDPELVWGWYEWRRARMLRAQPNAAHRVIAALADRVPKLTLVTQNVDDLHERAGSSGVIHLHGELNRPYCSSCGHAHDPGIGIPDEPDGGRRLAPPRCTGCGAPIRPGVVWFGESLPQRALQGAFDAAAACDFLFVIGTSGLVMPAAQIPARALQAQAKVVEINPAPMLRRAHWAIAQAAGEAMAAVFERFCAE